MFVGLKLESSELALPRYELCKLINSVYVRDRADVRPRPLPSQRPLLFYFLKTVSLTLPRRSRRVDLSRDILGGYMYASLKWRFYRSGSCKIQRRIGGDFYYFFFFNTVGEETFASKKVYKMRWHRRQYITSKFCHITKFLCHILKNYVQ